MGKFLRTNILICFHLIVISKYSAIFYTDNNTEQTWINYCLDDIRRFPAIFSNEPQCCCSTLMNDIELVTDIGTEFNKIFGSRKLEYGIYQNAKQIVIKHFADDSLIDWIENQMKTVPNPKAALELALNNTDRYDRIHICPNGQYRRFTQQFHDVVPNELYLLLLMNINPEPILLNILQSQGFPVPLVYTKCGFIFTQTFNGDSLHNFYSHPFNVRVHIGKQLLKAALKFSYGTDDGFRIYLTDATPDNIVVNRTTFHVTFIDLTNIIVLDSKAEGASVSSQWRSIHKHEKIECDGCFAYVPKELCEHNLSDINVFAICQLLREDLHGNSDKGFLHSIPDDILQANPQLPSVLKECMHCGDIQCDNRFNSAKELIKIFENILKHHGF